MRTASWLLPAELLLLVGSLLPLASAASPSVNIGLRASFDRAPYLVELIETAAEENESIYFKLLDRVAEGYFKNAKTDQELYDSLLRLLKSDGLITEPESLSSFQLALSIRNAAPRVEAHYQYYRTSVEPYLEKSAARDCETWLEFANKQFCSPQFEKEDAVLQGLASPIPPRLPFDRQYGVDTALPATLYADITSQDFTRFHPLLKEAAEKGKVAYRLRHRPSGSASQALDMGGFGAELMLKKTDYIVIDDRNAAEKKEEKASEQDLDSDEEVNDLTPLSSSELADLGMKAASYVMNSDYPLKRLLKVTQDFPKYSSFLASQEISEPFRKEHLGNRNLFLPAGYSVMWMNGVQYDPRKMDAFSLLDQMRRERKLIASFNELGFSNSEAIQLLSHSAIAESQHSADTSRYEWRDEIEGGKIIIWLNDLEKDIRYDGWPTNLMAYLQRTYPGQMPMVRRDLHNVLIPVDFAEPKSVTPVIETIQDFVKRGVAVRFGLVPVTLDEKSNQQARVAYHIYETYGLSAMMSYFEYSLAGKKLAEPNENLYDSAVEGRQPKDQMDKVSLQAILESEMTGDRVAKAQAYMKRLGSNGDAPPVFVNGVPIKFDDDWLQSFSQRISVDMRAVQRAIFEHEVDEEAWLPDLFLKGASTRRNPLIIPEDEKDIRLLDLQKLYSGGNGDILNSLPKISAVEDESLGPRSQMIIAADFETEAALRVAEESLKFSQRQQNVDLVFAQNGKSKARSCEFASAIRNSPEANQDEVDGLVQRIGTIAEVESSDWDICSEWPPAHVVSQVLGINTGETVIMFNGRKLGPIPSDVPFTDEDFNTLYDFEVQKRVAPASAALNDLGLTNKLTNRLAHAKLYSVLALSTVSDMPEGIFELPPPIRSQTFYQWNSSTTAITVGNNSTAAIQIVAAIDPASEAAQRWVPILKVLSELDGVFLRVFLNPREKLQELPVKRFYRYALDSKPSFNANGSLQISSIHFEGIPKDALLTAGLDVSPSWLVAPKDSVHDLDNIKLSSLAAGNDVDAIYELEHILIEGHSRDMGSGVPPRGAQLALSTAKEEHFADTLIMANLGYFQFKANPGYYNISLLPGLSQKVFNIDSVGALGYDAQPGDESTEVTMMSFQGVTLYPRLSRKPGMEDEDVLGVSKTGVADSAAEVVSNGAKVVDGILSKVGVKKPDTGKYLSSALSGIRGLYSKARTDIGTHLGVELTATTKHADINIFSVASGHLYERMLNIMMLSVMKHTKSTVKFWFIEQFLSSSFKSFLPTLAAEYGFQYEFVTYKWPHWLRAQKEKQREIWGYKILFLDVLFPLDLDKVIFVDADQIVRTDMRELVEMDLQGAPYAFTPMCDSRTEMEGFRFWKQGYWKNFLRGLPYHISALYVVDLQRFRQIAAGDRLRQQYHQLSADPNSLSNLDQDLPNNMQMVIPIHTLPQEWLWCETWCSDESLKDAKTIDLCNNPQTKEPKLDRARRQVPEWTEYDDEIAALARRTQGGDVLSGGEQEREQKVEQEKEKARDVPEHGEL